MKDGQVHQVSNSKLNVQFLGSTGNGGQKYDPEAFNEGTEAFRYSPLIVGATTGLLSMYALVSMWPERKTTGITLFGTGLWSAYNGVKMFR